MLADSDEKTAEKSLIRSLNDGKHGCLSTHALIVDTGETLNSDDPSKERGTLTDRGHAPEIDESISASVSLFHVPMASHGDHHKDNSKNSKTFAAALELYVANTIDENIVYVPSKILDKVGAPLTDVDKNRNHKDVALGNGENAVVEGATINEDKNLLRATTPGLHATPSDITTKHNSPNNLVHPTNATNITVDKEDAGTITESKLTDNIESGTIDAVI